MATVVDEWEYGCTVLHGETEFEVHTEPSQAQKEEAIEKTGTDDPPPPWPWWVHPYEPAQYGGPYNTKEEAIAAIENGVHRG